MILEDYKNITGYDIQFLIEWGVDILTKEYPIFKNCLINGLDSSKYLKSINDWLLEYDRFQIVLSSYSISLDNSEYWDMLTRVDELWSFMKLCCKLEKFLRVVDLGSGIVRNRILRQNQSLENLGYETGNKWEDLAIGNGIIEEDYTIEGGNSVRTPLKFYFNSQNIESCVVSPVGEEIYGRDIEKEFILKNSDIVVLDNKETLFQTCYILISLVKGAIPFRKNMGIGNQDFVGTVAGFSYPVILRQISDSFKTDDSFSSISLVSIKRDLDKISLDFLIETRLGEMVNVQKKI